MPLNGGGGGVTVTVGVGVRVCCGGVVGRRAGAVDSRGPLLLADDERRQMWGCCCSWWGGGWGRGCGCGCSGRDRGIIGRGRGSNSREVRAVLIAPFALIVCTAAAAAAVDAAAPAFAPTITTCLLCQLKPSLFKACRILEAVEKAGWKREDVGASRYLMSEAIIGRTKRRGKKDFLGGGRDRL